MRPTVSGATPEVGLTKKTCASITEARPLSAPLIASTRMPVVGVSVRTTGMRVLAISGALSGLASVMLAQVFFVSPTSGVAPLTVGLIISLAGGLGSIPGTVAAAGLIGLAEAATARYLEQSLVPFVLFGVVVLILIFRPRGLGGLLEDVRE